MNPISFRYTISIDGQTTCSVLNKFKIYSPNSTHVSTRLPQGVRSILSRRGHRNVINHIHDQRYMYFQIRLDPSGSELKSSIALIGKEDLCRNEFLLIEAGNLERSVMLPARRSEMNLLQSK